MEKTSQENGAPAQGAETPVTKEVIQKWAKDDLARAISFLNALYSDPYLMDQIATFMHGKVVNYENAKKQQLNLDLEKSVKQNN